MRESLRTVLEPLVEEFADPPAGASEDQLERLSLLAGLEELPAAVDEYLRLVGADEGLTAELFAGESRFEIGRILEDPNWKDWPTELGVGEDLLVGAIRYTDTAEHVSWLLCRDPDSGDLVADPEIHYVVEDGTDGRAGTFLQDLERRVPFARENLYWLRRDIDDGVAGRAVVQADFGTPEFHQQVEEQLSYIEQLFSQAGIQRPSPDDYQEDWIRQRARELRGRLRD